MSAIFQSQTNIGGRTVAMLVAVVDMLRVVVRVVVAAVIVDVIVWVCDAMSVKVSICVKVVEVVGGWT